MKIAILTIAVAVVLLPVLFCYHPQWLVNIVKPFTQLTLVVRYYLAPLAGVGGFLMALLLWAGMMALPAVWLLGLPWWTLPLAALYTIWAVVSLRDFSRFQQTTQGRHPTS